MEMSICKLSLRIKSRLIETVDVCDSFICRSKSLMLFFPRSGGKVCSWFILQSMIRMSKESPRGKGQGPEWIAKGYGIKNEKVNVEMRL